MLATAGGERTGDNSGELGDSLGEASTLEDRVGDTDGNGGHSGDSSATSAAGPLGSSGGRLFLLRNIPEGLSVFGRC